MAILQEMILDSPLTVLAKSVSFLWQRTENFQHCVITQKEMLHHQTVSSPHLLLEWLTFWHKASAGQSMNDSGGDWHRKNVWRKLHFIWDDALFTVRVPYSANVPTYKQTSWPRVSRVWSLQARLWLSLSIYSVYWFITLACSFWSSWSDLIEDETYLNIPMKNCI